jgi:hypothetical protein
VRICNKLLEGVRGGLENVKVALCNEPLLVELKVECAGDYETVYASNIIPEKYHDNVIIFSSERDAEKVSIARRLFLDIAGYYRDPRYAALSWYPGYISFLARRLEEGARQQGEDIEDILSHYYRRLYSLTLIYNVAEVLALFLGPVLAVDIRREPRIYPVVAGYTRDGQFMLVRVDRLYMDWDTALKVVAYGLASYFDREAERGNEKALNKLASLRRSYAEELRRKHKAAVERALSAQDLRLDPKRIDEILSSAGVSREGSVGSFARDWIKSAYALEEEGRNLAYMLSREEPAKTPRFFKLLNTVAEWAGRVVESLEHARSVASQALTPDVMEYIVKLIHVFTTIKSSASLGVIGEDVWAALEELDKAARRLIGRGVLWAVQRSFASLVNTATSAYHALIEFVQMRTAGRALILTSDPRAEELAATFFKTIEEALKLGIRLEQFDLEPTYIAIRDNEVVMRLGSSPGHAAHLDTRSGVLRYYDEDSSVKEELLSLIREFVPVKHYEITDEELVVHFEPTYENIRKLVAIMPLAISMDFRIRDMHRITFWSVVAELLKRGEVDKILSMFEELGVSRDAVYKTAKTLREALMSADENAFHEYIEESHKTLAKYLEELNKALAAKAAETEEKIAASRNNRRPLAIAT